MESNDIVEIIDVKNSIAYVRYEDGVCRFVRTDTLPREMYREYMEEEQ